MSEVESVIISNSEDLNDQVPNQPVHNVDTSSDPLNAAVSLYSVEPDVVKKELEEDILPLEEDNVPESVESDIEDDFNHNQDISPSDDEALPEDVYNYPTITSGNPESEYIPYATGLEDMREAMDPQGNANDVDDIENMFLGEEEPVKRVVHDEVLLKRRVSAKSKSKERVKITPVESEEVVHSRHPITSSDKSKEDNECCGGTSCNSTEVSKTISKNEDCCGGNGCDNGSKAPESTSADESCCGTKSCSSSGSPAKNTKKPETQKQTLPINDEDTFGNVPHVGSVWIKTWGCSHNNSDGEYMAGLASSAGYEVTDDPDEAQIWILNSCTVKGPSEAHFIGMLKDGKEKGKGVVVAGCVPQAQPKHPEFASKTFPSKSGSTAVSVQTDSTNTSMPEKNTPLTMMEQIEIVQSAALSEATSDVKSPRLSSFGPWSGVVSMLGVQQLDRVVEIIDETMKGRAVRLMETVKTAGSPLSLPKIRKNPLIEIIPINTGCLNQCSYCKTKQARGQLRSYPLEELVNRLKEVLSEGVREIWLTSEDLGTYGRDIGTSLPKLLDALTAVMTEGTMLRLGMTNPPYIIEHLEEISRALRHPRVYSFLHIPVQAGADDVLNEMRRDYSNGDFRHVCDTLLRLVPGITIATDIICGFPTETEADWRDTVKLCDDYKFPILHINQFYPRPSTPAARLPLLDTRIVKARSRELSLLFNSYTTRDKLLNTVQQVLVTDLSTDKKYFVAHNKSYDQILVPKRPELMGATFDVRITEVFKHYMFGEVIEDSLSTKPILPEPIEVGAIATRMDPEELKSTLDEYKKNHNRFEARDFADVRTVLSKSAKKKLEKEKKAEEAKTKVEETATESTSTSASASASSPSSSQSKNEQTDQTPPPPPASPQQTKTIKPMSLHISTPTSDAATATVTDGPRSIVRDPMSPSAGKSVTFSTHVEEFQIVPYQSIFNPAGWTAGQTTVVVVAATLFSIIVFRQFF